MVFVLLGLIASGLQDASLLLRPGELGASPRELAHRGPRTAEQSIPPARIGRSRRRGYATRVRGENQCRNKTHSAHHQPVDGLVVEKGMVYVYVQENMRGLDMDRYDDDPDYPTAPPRVVRYGTTLVELERRAAAATRGLAGC